ncbi:MAG TPA: hypothetical protein VH206_14475 [Xanthobacteraceae bacterium]|nr:hypothetical protein [Xanthobacteraceae bacterium]
MSDRTIITATSKASRSRTSTELDWWPVAAFSIIGLLLTLNVMLRFPDWGAIISQYNQF